jgi:hypothetical protein
MASTRLAEAVGYPGSSVAFAQLLSGMERDGLITREVRGKRTYRIILAPGVRPGRSRPGDDMPGLDAQAADGRTAVPAVIVSPSVAPAFDYDELARRLLIQVIRRIATPPEGHEGVVADLERELTAARGRATNLTAENRKLREQLRQVQYSLDAARRTLEPAGPDADNVGYGTDTGLAGTGPVASELSDAEVVLLERLASPAHDAMLDIDAIAPDATAS